MRSHLKAIQITMGITLLLDADRVMNPKTMVSLSRTAGASIAAIKSLICNPTPPRSIGVTYKFRKFKDLLPEVHDKNRPTKKQMKESYAKKSHFLNDLDVGIEIGEEN